MNACRAPGEWQTYDIFFTRPRFAADGSLEMTNQIDSLQQEAISKGSRSTSLPSKDCSVNSRFASRTS